jgi:hypothetical protein
VVCLPESNRWGPLLRFIGKHLIELNFSVRSGAVKAFRRRNQRIDLSRITTTVNTVGAGEVGLPVASLVYMAVQLV